MSVCLQLNMWMRKDSSTTIPSLTNCWKIKSLLLWPCITGTFHRCAFTVNASYQHITSYWLNHISKTYLIQQLFVLFRFNRFCRRNLEAGRTSAWSITLTTLPVFALKDLETVWNIGSPLITHGYCFLVFNYHLMKTTCWILSFFEIWLFACKSVAVEGYETGEHAPGLKLKGTGAYRAAHHIIKVREHIHHYFKVIWVNDNGTLFIYLFKQFASVSNGFKPLSPGTR